MTHTIEKYGDIGNFSGVTSVILPFMNLKYVGTFAPTARIIGNITDFYVLNVPKTQPRHNPATVFIQKLHINGVCKMAAILFRVLIQCQDAILPV